MADCSYARCLQERRSIKRELQRWTKNMVFVVGLERVAEELMGRRKWKLYQDVLLARNLPLPQPDDNDALSDSAPQEDEEHSHMIATTETIQRHTTAADLVSTEQEGQVQKSLEKSLTDHHQVGSPITLDEDSKEDADDLVTRPSREEENDSPKDDSPALAPSVLKIKTIEEINTVGVDAGINQKEGEGGETILEGLIKRNSSGPPRRSHPADWTPQDKCYFCVDGELVRPGTANAPETASEQPPSPAESESGSSSSRSGPSPPRGQFIPTQQQEQAQALLHLLQLHQANFNPSAMNQVQSMPASLAALAALGGGGGLSLGPTLGLCQPNLLPHWYLNARATNTPDRTPSSTDKSMMATSRSSPLHTEQPLDLSSKSGGQDSDVRIIGESSSISADIKSNDATSPSTLEARLASLRVPPIDPKQLFKSKPRLIAAGGRKTYTEDELQAALRDIQSGRLGTRRAAVLYNIPRSTLRNKVYKLAVEKERGGRPPGPLAAIDRDDSNDITDDMDDDKDSLMDDDKDEDAPKPRLSMEDILKFSQMDGYGETLKNSIPKRFFHMDGPKRNPAADAWPGVDPNLMAPYIQSILMASGLGPPLGPKPEDGVAAMMPEIARFLAEEQQRNILKEQLTKQDRLDNGKPADDDDPPRRLYSRQSSAAGSVVTKSERKTDSPDDSPMEIGDAGESRDSPSNVILKIPSFKPLANAPNPSKNGEAFAGPATPPLPYFSRSPRPDQTARGHGSPPLGQPKGVFSLRDVIAKSISQKFQQQGPPLNHYDPGQAKAPGLDAMEGLNAFKRGRATPPTGGQGISVIKNLAGHDLARSFGNSNAGGQAQQNNATGGKGTRPKRGKYRNYDRDSLVEAVKAVQRGEMSVHRAGSYYGVPHSTLEYKVKERHLMRPRKREPKNPNPDDKTSMAGGAKPGEAPGGVLRPDKAKAPQKPPAKPSFPAGSPNGLKMPAMFDPALALGYSPSPFPFWPHAPPFHGVPVDFQPRNPAASAAFPSGPAESFFASQMMQRLQEESARHPPQKSGGGGGGGGGNALLKSARDMAEFYESAGAGANGSFLEGIIRASLEPEARRPDDALLAEEMREATRRLRAREAPPPHPPAPGSAGSSPPRPV